MQRLESTLSSVRDWTQQRRPTWPRELLPDDFDFSWALGSGWQPSKLLSLALTIFVGGALFWFHMVDACFIYREDVSFANLTYLAGDELYGDTGVESWNALWIEPETIRANLQQHAYVADAAVQVRLPGSLVVEIQEIAPTALWITDAGTFWLLDDGSALPIRKESTEPILQIIDGGQVAQAADKPTDSAIDVRVLNSAQRLLDIFPELDKLRYDAQFGLNFPLPGHNIYVYWGDGADIETKLQNLAAAQQLLLAGEINAQILDLRYLNRPYFQ